MCIVPVAQVDSKNILECSQELDQITLYLLHQKELDFLCTLRFIWTNSNWYERDIVKNPTLCGAKNSNKLRAPNHLVTWIPHSEQ